MKALEGAFTALVTPMVDGGIDEPALTRLVEEQIAAGIDGLVAVGTTGESATLSVDEHVGVVRRVVELAAGRVPVIAGAGANATPEAIELSRASERAGADGLLQVTPYYNRPSQEGLYQHFSAVARATRLPIMLYNVPGRTSCDLLPDTVERLAEIDNVVAIKEASTIPRAGELIARLGDRLAVLSGDDAASFPILALGGRGMVSVVSNVVPGRVAAMWDAASRDDVAAARALHLELLPLARMLFREPSPAPVKAALEIRGLIGPEIRLPLVRCSAELKSRIAQHLESRGWV